MLYHLKFAVLENEFWWGGAIHDGTKMPFSDKTEYEIDLRINSRGNQSMPFYLSTKGRYIWSDEAFFIRFSHGKVTAESDRAPVVLEETDGTIREAYRQAVRKHFPFSGVCPEEAFYRTPQYNTWSELTYNQNQESVLGYAENVIRNGYQPGILTIDDGWNTDYGVWEFNPARFPDPKKMCDRLAELGFQLMLWICPYISADSAEFRDAREKDCLITDKTGRPLMLEWWNGFSACIDFTKESARRWMDGKLNPLMEKYGVCGFKFDGGSVSGYAQLEGKCEKTACELNHAYFEYAEKFRFHETKDTWKAGGRPMNQRLRDKTHRWNGEGMSSIVPDTIALALTGHPFLCPDMVGGGEWTDFLPGCVLDEELVVRFAELASFFPMMQFSVAPWRILSAENNGMVRKAAGFHLSFADEIMDLVRKASETGEPVLAPLCYHDPDGGFEEVRDELMIGENILAAPVLEKGKTERKVVFPAGLWKDAQGNLYEGGTSCTVPAPLDCLPLFRRADRA